MNDPFHPGELAVQERAGVRAMARKIGGGIHTTIVPAAKAFLAERELAVAAGVEESGAVWTSLLTGPRGFLEAVGDERLRVHALPREGDPLAGCVRDGGTLGLLVIELSTRKRTRLNGTVERRPGGFDLVVLKVFGNCPKYIQARATEPAARAPREPPAIVQGTTLGPAQRRWIAAADTFFVGSVHGEAGADASHRGGNPGFVRVVDESRIAWPDYTGNMMFQTLGNLQADGRAGLLFIDFAGGGTLQATGRASIDWDPARAAAFAGAERVVDFTIGEVVEAHGHAAPRFRLLERSPFNPA
jgi:uncharacterized protein